MSEVTTEKKPGFFENLKGKVDSKEEQLNVFSTFIRLGILVWSGAILTLNYVTIPKFPQNKIDPTFIASVFTGTLATFGVQATKSNGKNSNGNGGCCNTGPVQTIKIEQKPLKITTED